jgi:hypothetical protein
LSSPIRGEITGVLGILLCARQIGSSRTKYIETIKDKKNESGGTQHLRNTSKSLIIQTRNKHLEVNIQRKLNRERQTISKIFGRFEPKFHEYTS